MKQLDNNCSTINGILRTRMGKKYVIPLKYRLVSLTPYVVMLLLVRCAVGDVFL